MELDEQLIWARDGNMTTGQRQRIVYLRSDNELPGNIPMSVLAYLARLPRHRTDSYCSGHIVLRIAVTVAEISVCLAVILWTL